MLKFADLSVDFKSYENSFDSLMKLIPGSYYPLLIMYLAHKGILKLEVNFDKEDQCTLVSVDGDILHDFFGNDLLRRVIQKGPDFEEKSDMDTALRKLSEAILKDRDFYVMSPFLDLLPMILAGKSVALVADVPEGNQVLDLINILGIKNPDPNTSAALLFFSLMLMSKYHEHEYDDLSSEEDIANEKRWAHRIWVEDFENAMNKIMSYSGEKSCSQPKEITRLILTQYKGGSIYNPFAGIASYNIQRYYECNLTDFVEPARNLGNFYYGEEINAEAWALGKLRLLAYDCDSENYILGDSTNWREGEANNIFCTPPFGYKIDNEFGKKEYADHFVIRRGLDLLAEDGLLACVVPLSFMARKDTEDIRERIIKDGFLESVVYLPENIFEGTSIRTAILFIRKAVHTSVALINATSAVFSKRGKVNVLNVEFAANLLYHKYYTSDFAFDSEFNMAGKLSANTFSKLRVSVPNEKVEKSNYDLTPGRYLLSNLIPAEGFTLKLMGDLVSGVSETTKKPGRGKVIRPALLSKDGYTHLNAESLQEDDYKKGYGIIESNALLFSPLSSMRPTLLLNPNGEKLYYKTDTLQAVYVKEDFVLPEYVVLELYKSYIQEQVMLLAKGDVIPRLALSDFMCLRIAIPSIARQALKIERELVDDQKNLHFSKLNAELVALKDKQHDDYVKMLRQRKHRIQQVMNEFAPAFNLLNQCRIKNDGVLHDSDIVALRTGETVESYFSKLENIVAKVEDLITNLVDKEHWEEATLIDIDDYVADIPESHLSDKFKFQIFSDIPVTIEGEEGDAPIVQRLVKINKDDLTTVFDNIIANATKWGFTDNTRRDYAIRIEVSDLTKYDIPAVSISISNNGEPIHPSVDRKRFFEWGYGSGSGIGTWQLKDIVEHYGGTIELHEYSEKDTSFAIEYYIILPLANNE